MAPAANAGPTSSTTAIVALGDSFSSGEAGRWNGNSLNIFGTRDGTDRAARCTLGIFCSYDATRVYGSSYGNGCHRADVAPIKSAPISVNEKINLACSGAQTTNIWRASQGGQAFKGEAPQADQLLPIAQQKNVKLVLLNISANDLGFTDHVIDCTVAWTLGFTCNAQEQAEIVAAPAGRGERAAQGGRRDPGRDDGGRLLDLAVQVRHAGLRLADPGRREHPLPAVELGPAHGGRLPVLRRGRELGQEHGHAHDRGQHAQRRGARRACGSSTCATRSTGTRCATATRAS